VQGLCRLLNALAADQAAGSVAGGAGEGGCARTFFERAALWGSGQGLEQVEISEKTGKGVKNKSWVLHEPGIVQDLCWKGPSQALCCWLGRCCLAGKAAWYMEEGDSPPCKAGKRGQDCVMSPRSC